MAKKKLKYSQYDLDRAKARGVDLGVCFTIACMIAILTLFFTGSDADIINTDEYGKTVCGAMGLEYSHREIGTFGEPYSNSSHIPKVFCKEKEVIKQKRLPDIIEVI